MVDMKITKLFFDQPKVRRAVDTASRKAMSEAGGFIRTTARRSIKKAPYVSRKQRGKERTDLERVPSRPGSPPHSRGGQLKRYLFYHYDPNWKTVVIGPAKTTWGTDTPHILEFGGATVTKRARLVSVGKAGRGKGGRFTKARRRMIRKGTRVTIAARPYMAPALEVERPKLPRRWANSIVKG